MNELLELNINCQTFRVTNRESDRKEFKFKYENNSLWSYVKTMVSMANKDGGIIFFGIRANPHELIENTGEQPDDAVIANFVKSHFEPEIHFELNSKSYCGRTLFYILVHSSSNKPIICKKNKLEQFKEKGKQDKELLREGAIYYRYSSTTEEIKYPELANILQERVQKQFRSLIDNITLINKVGLDKAAIVDASNLSGSDKMTSVFITTDTAKNINWIKKGRFSESDSQADKAYYVTREIEIKHGVEIEKPVNPSKTHTLTKTALTKEVRINNCYINSILWKLGLLDNETYHIPIPHGKTILHKYTLSAKNKILAGFPFDLADRKAKIMEIHTEYNQSLRQ